MLVLLLPLITYTDTNTFSTILQLIQTEYKDQMSGILLYAEYSVDCGPCICDYNFALTSYIVGTV
jgi:hypothetical protein